MRKIFVLATSLMKGQLEPSSHRMVNPTMSGVKIVRNSARCCSAIYSDHKYKMMFQEIWKISRTITSVRSSNDAVRSGKQCRLNAA